MNAEKINDVDNVMDLESLVLQVEELSELTSDDIGPLIVPLMRVTSDSTRVDPKIGAPLTQRLLSSCLSRCSGQYDDLQPFPTTGMYNRSIIAWGNLRSWEGAERANAVWQVMQYENELERGSRQNQEIGKTITASPNRQTYKSLMRAYAVSSDSRGPSKALEVLDELEQICGMSDLLTPDGDEAGVAYEMLPDTACYDMVLYAYATQPWKSASEYHDQVQTCWKIARRLDGLNSALKMRSAFQDTSSAPSDCRWTGMTYQGLFRLYDSYLQCAAENGMAIDSRVPIQLVGILRRIAITGWDGIPQNDRFQLARAYGITISAFVAINRLQQAYDLLSAIYRGDALLLGLPEIPRLDSRTFPLLATLRLAHAYDLRGETKGKKEALELILRHPTGRSFELNERLKAIRKFTEKEDWHDGVVLMEDLLDRAMTQGSRSRPTGESFALVMATWVSLATKDAPVQCEILCDKLRESFRKRKQPWLEPKLVHLELVMRAWMTQLPAGRLCHGAHGYAWPAAHVEEHARGGFAHTSWKRSFLISLAVEAWAKQHTPFGKTDSNLPDPLSRSLQLLTELDDTGPDSIIPHHWVLQLCSKRFRTSRLRTQAFHAGLRVWGRMKCRNSFSYTRLAILVLRHSKAGIKDDVRSTVIEAFRDCCSQGLLTQQFLWAILYIHDVELMATLWDISLEEAGEHLAKARKHLRYSNARWNWTGQGQIPAFANVDLLSQELLELTGAGQYGVNKVGDSQNGPAIRIK